MGDALTIQDLRDRLDADCAAGVVFWKHSDTMGAYWNARYAHKQAMNTLNGDGYLSGKINKKTMSCHKVIWAMHYGEWPHDQIDHINGVRTDNRIENLRCVSNAENAKNQKRRHDNKSGIVGVKYHKATKKFAAAIKVDGKNFWLGVFPTISEAAAARISAELRFGFTGRANAALIPGAKP